MRRLPDRTRQRHRRDEDAGVLPLVNVVFLLLIFFIVAGRIAPGDPFRVNPPEAAQDAAASTAPVEIVMAADGRIALDGVETTPEAVGAALAAREVSSARLRADGAAEARAVARMMETLRAAGIGELVLVTRRGAR